MSTFSTILLNILVLITLGWIFYGLIRFNSRSQSTSRNHQKIANINTPSPAQITFNGETFDISPEKITLLESENEIAAWELLRKSSDIKL